METVNVQQQNEPSYKDGRGGRAFGGLILVAAGALWLVHRMHLVFFPSWVFYWPVWLIALGFYIGARRRFQGGGWQVLMLIGGVFLIPHLYWYYTGLSLSEYTWPLLIIVIGLYMIIRPKPNFRNSDRYKAKWRKYEDWKKYEGWNTPNNPPTGSYTSTEDFIDSTAFFGGVHKVIVSKNFKGGDVVNIFGGAEINLTQADFTGTVTLDLTQIFGGSKIIVPTDWRIQTKMTSIFGGVEDKRPPSLIKENPDKTLIIDGTSIFAGISIQCY